MGEGRAGMVPADGILITWERQIDERIAAEGEIQRFLTWSESKAGNTGHRYKAGAARAFYAWLGVRDRARALDRASRDERNTNLVKSLRQLRPFVIEHQNDQAWWMENGPKWIQELRAAMTEYRDIGHKWDMAWNVGVTVTLLVGESRVGRMHECGEGSEEVDTRVD